MTEWSWPKSLQTSDDRFKEIQRALSENVDCGLFDEIVLFGKLREGLEKIDQTRIRFVEHDPRPTFQQIFALANAEYPQDRIMVANNDISFKLIKSLALEPNDFVVMSRHEFESEEAIWNEHSHLYMQDGWCFDTPCRIRDAHFLMGRVGCDNRLAWLAYVAKYRVKNMGREWPAIHYHMSSLRTAQWSKFVTSPYLTVDTQGNTQEYWGNRNKLLEMLRSAKMGSYSAWHTLAFAFRYTKNFVAKKLFGNPGAKRSS